MSETRIYVVHDRELDKRVLVRASSAWSAARHVTKPRFGAAVATQEQLVRMVLAGEQIQDASSESAGS